MAKVSLIHVNKIYPGNIVAVSDFSLDIDEGEFVVLVGPSGCGKSTTLRMIAGLEEITGGTIRIGDRIVNEVLPKDRDVAMVFQNYALYPHMTVRQNMAFGLKLRKYPRADIEKRVNEAAGILGLTGMLDRRPRALSGGQRQRVAVGRAIVRQPAAFLFDEPLSNLDAKLRVQMRLEISQLHNRLKSTMIYVTHDQVEAMTMGERIVVMKEGIVQQVADPITLYDKPANRFVAGFIGTPPMNIFEGTLAERSGNLSFTADGGVDLPVPGSAGRALGKYAGKQVAFGVRPEDIGPGKSFDAPGWQKIKARVEVVEPLGSETYVHLACGNREIVSRMKPHARFKAGDDVEIAVDMDKAHFFDTVSGTRI